MCNQIVLPLSLNGDTFNALKSDFDSILRNTLSNMELKGADTAEMNIKLKISLSKEQTRDLEASYDGAMRDIIKPKFEHAVQSVLQIKDKKDGTLSGNYELVWDGDAQKYVMREITDGQTSLFDEEQKPGFDPNNIVVVGGELPPAKKELPAPDEDGDFIDAEYTVVEDGEPATTDPGPFDWLRQFVGASMKVMEAMGNYTVRTDDNKVVLSSAASADSPFYCPAEKLAPHVGHTIVCILYGDKGESVFIECDTCGETLFRLDAPGPNAHLGEDDSAAPAPGEEDAPDGYKYEDPDGHNDKEAC